MRGLWRREAMSGGLEGNQWSDFRTPGHLFAYRKLPL